MASPPIKPPEPFDSQLTKVLGEALAAYAGDGTRPKGRTASELAADVMFEGPGDLSTNLTYVAGYGCDARHR